MAINKVHTGAHPAPYRAQDAGRSGRRFAERIKPGAELIAALLFSLGLWGVTIWLVVSSLARVWT